MGAACGGSPMPAGEGPRLDRAGVLQALAHLVAGGLPVPREIRFHEPEQGCPCLHMAFESTSHMDAWLAMWGQPDTRAHLFENSADGSGSWQYRPAGYVVRWAGWEVYPLVIHLITSEMAVGRRPGDAR